MKKIITLIICGVLSGVGLYGFGIPKNIDWTSSLNKIVEETKKENLDKKNEAVENLTKTEMNSGMNNNNDNVIKEEKPSDLVTDIKTEEESVVQASEQKTENDKTKVESEDVQQQVRQSQESDKPSNTVETPSQQALTSKTTSPASAPPSTSVGTSNFSDQIEQLIFTKVNEERAKAGVSTLNYSSLMEKYARIKSQDMGDRNYFDHQNPEGELITSQMDRDGITYRAWGENIAYIGGVTDLNQLAEQFMTNWMNSSGHRANILSENFTSIGVGVYKSGNRYYATQEFYK